LLHAVVERLNSAALPLDKPIMRRMGLPRTLQTLSSILDAQGPSGALAFMTVFSTGTVPSTAFRVSR